MKRSTGILLITIIALAFHQGLWAQERPALKQTVKRAQEQISAAKANLKVRVSEYWKALIAGNPDKAYDCVEPSAQNRENRSRFVSGMSKFQFIRYEIKGISFQFIRYEIKGISIKGDEASVTVRREFKIAPGVIPLDPGLLHQTLTDRWVKVKGKWYAAYNRPVLPFSGNRRKRPAPSVSIPKQDTRKRGGEKKKESQK